MITLHETQLDKSSHIAGFQEQSMISQRLLHSIRSCSNSEVVYKKITDSMTENLEKISTSSKNSIHSTEFRIKTTRKEEFGCKLPPFLVPLKNSGSNLSEVVSSLPRIIVTTADDEEIATQEIQNNFARKVKTLNTSFNLKIPTGIRSDKRFFVENLKPIRAPNEGSSKQRVLPISKKDLKSKSDVSANHSDHQSTNSNLIHIPENTEGRVKAFGVNTNNGLVKNYNEDKVSIILDIKKPTHLSNETWPRCSFFAVYDGHGGAECADFLKENLYRYIIREPSFPSNPQEALMKGFQAAESKFLEISQASPDLKLDRCGSYALVVLIVGDVCYVANVGSSRAVMSGDQGNKIFALTKDHKPSDTHEQKRIIEAGGKVSRTIGDAHAKLPEKVGNPNVVISEPEIRAFKIHSSYDFIIIGTDGIFDKMTNKECIETAWRGIHSAENKQNAHEKCASCVEFLLREAMDRRSLDNVTAVMMISFSALSTNHLEESRSQPQKEDSQLLGIQPPALLKRRVTAVSLRITTNSDIDPDISEQIQTPSKKLADFYKKSSVFRIKAGETRRNSFFGSGQS